MTEAPKVAFGTAPVESDENLRKRARLSSQDVQGAKDWVKSFTKSTLVVNVLVEGAPKRWLTAGIYRQMWEARSY